MIKLTIKKRIMSVFRFVGNSILAGYCYVKNMPKQFRNSPNTRQKQLRSNSTEVVIENTTCKKTLKMLSKCRDPYSIRLINCDIDLSCALILEAILEYDTLRILYLYSTSINADALEVISEAISKNTSLFTLRIESIDSGQKDDNIVFSISKAIANNKSIKKFEIYNYDIGQNTAKAISNILNVNTTLTNLIMNNNSIVSEEANYILDSMINNNTLLNLDMANNNICDDATYYISNMLIYNTTLISLNLCNNQIGTLNVTRGLVNNSSLTDLVVSLDYNFNIDCVHEFNNMLKNNFTLTNLTLHFINTQISLKTYMNNNCAKILERNKKCSKQLQKMTMFRKINGLPDELNFMITKYLINYIQ